MTNIKEKIIGEAKKLGFDLIGFSAAHLDKKYLKAYKDWLKKNLQADMAYMEKSRPREDSQNILPATKTVISLGINYYHKQENPQENEGLVARYAYGRDYHKIIPKKLKKLENFIRENWPHSQTKSYVDTGPVLERAFSEQANLGQIGKNACLISQQFGSWLFLSEIFTTLKITPDQNKKSSQPFSVCGSCTRCMDACPTGAIIAPGVIDSKKCISYQTIENKGKIPPQIAKAIKKSKRLFGCDICQEVCPHNCRAKPGQHKEFLDPKIAGDSQDLKKVAKIRSDEEFLHEYAGSPLMRAKRKKLQEVAKIIGED